MMTASAAQRLAVLAAALVVSASTSPAAERAVVDVSLSPQSVMTGRYVDAHGGPLVGAQIVMRDAQQVIGRTQTDADGRFAFADLQTGVYQIQAGSFLRNVRIWEHRIAPPQSHAVLMVVQPEPVVRGGAGASSDAVLIAGVVGAFAVSVSNAVELNERHEDLQRNAVRQNEELNRLAAKLQLAQTPQDPLVVVTDPDTVVNDPDAVDQLADSLSGLIADPGDDSSPPGPISP